MKHSKRYKRVGIGVELLCGTRVVADNDTTRFANWSLLPCPICDMRVWTWGHSPDTDMVEEDMMVTVVC